MRQARMARPLIVVAAALVLAIGTVQPAASQQSDFGHWFERLADVQRRISNYHTRLDSLIYAIDAGRATASHVCDPAGMRQLHEAINQELARLIAEARHLNLEQDAIAALNRMEENWIALQRRQFERWDAVSKMKNIESKELCLPGGDLILFRIEMAEDQETLAKAVVRRLAKR